MLILPKKSEVSKDIFCENDVKLLGEWSKCFEDNKKYHFLISDKSRRLINSVFYMHNHDSVCPDYPLDYPLPL